MEKITKKKIVNRGIVKVWTAFYKHQEVSSLEVGEIPFELYTSCFAPNTYIGEIDIEIFEKYREMSLKDVNRILKHVDNTPPSIMYWALREDNEKEDNKENRIIRKKQHYLDVISWLHYPEALNNTFKWDHCVLCGGGRRIPRDGLCMTCYTDLTENDSQFLEFLDKVAKEVEISKVRINETSTVVDLYKKIPKFSELERRDLDFSFQTHHRFRDRDYN